MGQVAIAMWVQEAELRLQPASGPVSMTTKVRGKQNKWPCKEELLLGSQAMHVTSFLADCSAQ